MKLKRCPFCGVEARIKVNNKYSNIGFTEYRIGCDNAMCHGYYYNGLAFESDKEAIAAWNQRKYGKCDGCVRDVPWPSFDQTCNLCVRSSRGDFYELKNEDDLHD